mgnify:FL=1|tara:strand:+ start:172 stop:453 length:282 start_codon:yes stop_codon:yes gene_type:complete
MDAESGIELAAARLVDEKTVRQTAGAIAPSGPNFSNIDFKQVDPLNPPGYPDGQGKTKEVAMLLTTGGRDHSLLVTTSPQPPLSLLDLLSISP